MSRVTRRSLAAAAVAGALTASGIALASGRDGSSNTTHVKPRLSERRILRIAEKAAAGAGDQHPTLIQHAQGTRHEANLVDSGDGIAGRQWSYLIAERGHFVVRNSEGVSGSAVPHGSVLTLIVDASTGQVTDFGVADRYPDLAKLGPVHTDLRRAPGHRSTRPSKRDSGAVNYAVDIQAGYDRHGNPALGANFYPNGGLAKPRWAIRSPRHVSVCTPAGSASQFIEPGRTPAGTVFQASVNFGGSTTSRARRSGWARSTRRVGPGCKGRPPRARGWIRGERSGEEDGGRFADTGHHWAGTPGAKTPRMTP